LYTIKIALKYLSISNGNLLKTDLWNEGVECQRDILKQFERHDNMKLFGVDIAHVTCVLAKNNLNKVNVLQGDIRSLPFKDASFDMVLDLSTLDHVPLHQALEAIQEYKRVLKKDGILVLIFWTTTTLPGFRLRLSKMLHPNQPVNRPVNTQYHFPVRVIRDCVISEIQILRENRLGSFLNISFNMDSRLTRLFLRKLPASVCHFIARIECSSFSKYQLRNIAGLYLIIGRRRA
jgi:SAM-dependent methyltransferase